MKKKHATKINTYNDETGNKTSKLIEYLALYVLQNKKI